MEFHNKTLEGIDPHDPNLSLPQKMAIVEECLINPRYFLLKVLREPIPQPNSDKVPPARDYIL